GGFGGEGAAGAGDLGAIDITAVGEALGDHADAAGLIDVDRDELAAGLQVYEDRGAVADGLEIVDGERHTGLPRHGEEVQHGIGRAAGSSDSGDGVLESLAG